MGPPYMKRKKQLFAVAVIIILKYMFNRWDGPQTLEMREISFCSPYTTEIEDFTDQSMHTSYGELTFVHGRIAPVF